MPVRILGIVLDTCRPPWVSNTGILTVRWIEPLGGDGVHAVYTGKALLRDGALVYDSSLGVQWPEEVKLPLNWPMEVLQAVAEMLPDCEEG